MKIVMKAVQAGNFIINCVAGILVLCMLLYGSYSLWDTARILNAGFADEELMKLKPVHTETGNTDTNSDNNASLKELQRINSDVCGWITIDGTNMDYPVVQGTHDLEYINKDIKGEFSLSGSIFLSSVNSSDFSDRYNLLYGHYMENGAMFGNVTNFVDKEYFSEHTGGYLYLPDMTCRIVLFACVKTDAFDPMIFHPDQYGKKNNDDSAKNRDDNRENSRELLTYIKERAVQYREMDITENDGIIGLSTCAEAASNGRIVLFGKLKVEAE